MPELFNPASIFVSGQKVWIPAFAGMTPLPMIQFNVVELIVMTLMTAFSIFRNEKGSNGIIRCFGTFSVQLSIRSRQGSIDSSFYIRTGRKLTVLFQSRCSSAIRQVTISPDHLPLSGSYNSVLSNPG
jgi:hypothetical protein